jgi:hypothetical protein
MSVTVRQRWVMFVRYGNENTRYKNGDGIVLCDCLYLANGSREQAAKAVLSLAPLTIDIDSDDGSDTMNGPGQLNCLGICDGFITPLEWKDRSAIGDSAFGYRSWAEVREAMFDRDNWIDSPVEFKRTGKLETGVEPGPEKPPTTWKAFRKLPIFPSWHLVELFYGDPDFVWDSGHFGVVRRWVLVKSSSATEAFDKAREAAVPSIEVSNRDYPFMEAETGTLSFIGSSEIVAVVGPIKPSSEIGSYAFGFGEEVDMKAIIEDILVSPL